MKRAYHYLKGRQRNAFPLVLLMSIGVVEHLGVLAARLPPSMSKILLGFGALVVVYIAWSAFSSESPKRLEIDQNEWWGPNELKGKQDTSIRPFKVQFTEEMIKDLRNRLKNHRPFTPPLEGIAFQYGFNTKAIEPWLKFWAEEYPFKEREAFFNKFPHYKTNIQGLDIHFMRIKPQVPAGVDVVPLIILHGWPGSVREFYEAIPLLTQQQPGYNFAFEVIAPSLPGFGFSDHLFEGNESAPLSPKDSN
ncbi:Juvenile hormone epoxide hydrolase [Papilio xuthus]|uniref:Juvenile hormone epoxide hydrolase n=1 Tax=Papilio xuthus TaxID=66420 RepID=A0A194PZ59_PAPXU|nr:Juvenile hormone epoxide hydrolase [Papilio xuthus]